MSFFNIIDSADKAIKAKQSGYNWVYSYQNWTKVYKSDSPDGDYMNVNHEDVENIRKFFLPKSVHIDILIHHYIKIENDGWIPLVYGIYPKDGEVVTITTYHGKVIDATFERCEGYPTWTNVMEDYDFGDTEAIAYREQQKPYKGRF